MKRKAGQNSRAARPKAGSPSGSRPQRRWVGDTVRRFTTICGMACLILLCPTAGLRAAPASLGEPATEWDALFQSTNGWIGADGNYSVPLSKQTTLWLFSDTFVGEVREGRRTNARMINNSIALQRGTNRPAFFYGTARDGRPESFIKPKTGKGYFWLGPGVRTADGLFLFLNQTITVRPDSPFGFKFLDSWLGHVVNPDDPPAQWRITQTKIPFTKVASKGALIFGGAVLPEADFIYIYGNDTRPSAKGPATAGGTVLARVAPADFANFKKWAFLANGQWQADFREVTPIAPAFASEFSISRLADSAQYVAVYTESIGGRIVLRLARTPAGPWSNPVEIYRAPEMKWPVSVFSYAGKAHPELVSEPGQLLVTYAANSWSFANLINDARLYWPRFVRVKLQ